MLGHGGRQPVAAPRIVAALSALCTVDVSCGGFHTACVASATGELTQIQVPSVENNSSRSSEHDDGDAVIGGRAAESASDRFRERDSTTEILICGQLYTWGLGKAGQLGQGATLGMLAIPTIVTSLRDAGYKAARVSCGFHHTLIIGVPEYSPRVFSTSIFACGWGEHGRLGVGDEEQYAEPTMVEFPEPFHALDISAGEQHSLASSGRQGAYAWGSNTMGQLGVCNPATTEMALTPTKIPIPEGMLIKRIAAGGRHSAAITRCGRLLTWGWGEDGQLGHGNEKSTYLPRPCKLPRIRGSLGTPVSVSLGMSHTIVVLRNNDFVPPAPPPAPLPSPKKPAPQPIREPEPEPEPDPEPEPEPEEIIPPLVVEVVKEEVKEVVVEEKEEEEEEVQAPPPVRKPVVMEEDEAPPVRSIRELLQRREERA